MSEIVKKLTNRLPFAPVVAVLFAGSSAALMMATPIWMLEKWVAKTGLSSIVSAAEAPLGFKARIAITLTIALVVGLLTLAAMIPVGRMLNAKKSNRHFAPSARSKSAAVTPFAPPREAPAADANDPGRFKPVNTNGDFGFDRAPIFADRELGAPFMSPEPVAAAVVAPVPEWPPVATPIAVKVETPVFASPEPAFDAPFIPASSYVTPAFAPATAPNMGEVEALELDMSQIADIPEMPNTPVFDAPAAPVALATEMQAFEELVAFAAAGSDDPDPRVNASPLQPAPQNAVPFAQATRTDSGTISAMLDRFETGLRRRQLQNLVSASSLGEAGINAGINTGINSGINTDAAADAALRDALGTLERLAANAR